MDYPIELVPLEAIRDHSGIAQVLTNEPIRGTAAFRRLGEQCQSGLFQRGIVVVVDDIESHDVVSALEQPHGGVKADESSVARNQDLHFWRRRMNPGLASSKSRKNPRASSLGTLRIAATACEIKAMNAASMPPASPPKTPLRTVPRASRSTASRGVSSTVMTGVSRTSRILASSRSRASDVYNSWRIVTSRCNRSCANRRSGEPM